MPHKQTKRKYAVSSSITLSQALHICKPVKRTRVNKISTVNQQLTEATFFIKDDVPWELTSNCTIRAKDSSIFYAIVLWRKRSYDKRGVHTCSIKHKTAIEAENNMFAFRYSLESGTYK